MFECLSQRHFEKIKQYYEIDVLPFFFQYCGQRTKNMGQSVLLKFMLNTLALDLYYVGCYVLIKGSV